MSRKNENPQKVVIKDMMSVFLEGALDGELDDSLGYNRYVCNFPRLSNTNFALQVSFNNFYFF